MKKAEVIVDDGVIDGGVVTVAEDKFGFIRDEAKYVLNMQYGQVEVIYVVNTLIHKATQDRVFNYSVWFAGNYFSSPINGFIVFCTSEPKDVSIISTEVINYLRQKFPIESPVDFSEGEPVAD